MAKVQFKQRTETTLLIVHCAATPPSMNIGLREIRQWHKEKGWLDVGYHFIIRRDGTIEDGRDVGAIGAHCEGKNYTSVGVCLVGGVDAAGKPQANFTPQQMQALKDVLAGLKVEYPEATVHGHREFAAKACPSFDVQRWLKTNELVTAK
ncbi:lysozyme [Pantoea phage vB_PagP-SK1]|uniref:Endolysin n=1 Tax=Pantoea phage vB_PagP-SK1 TaxID=2653646 RepID=A0A5P8NK62_9CAUD|nr:lysozyme [Pantoea phage vB_PagP-SK1]